MLSRAGKLIAVFAVFFAATNVYAIEQNDDWRVNSPVSAGLFDGASMNWSEISSFGKNPEKVLAPAGTAAGAWPYVVQQARPAYWLGVVLGVLSFFSTFVVITLRVVRTLIFK